MGDGVTVSLGVAVGVTSLVGVGIVVGVAVGVVSPVGTGVAEAEACGNSLAAVKVFALAMELSVKNAFVGFQIA